MYTYYIMLRFICIVQGGEANFANFRDLMIHRKLTSHPVSKIGEQLAQ